MSEKNIHAHSVGWKKPAQDAPWVDSMNFISQQLW